MLVLLLASCATPQAPVLTEEEKKIIVLQATGVKFLEMNCKPLSGVEDYAFRESAIQAAHQRHATHVQLLPLASGMSSTGGFATSYQSFSYRAWSCLSP